MGSFTKNPGQSWLIILICWKQTIIINFSIKKEFYSGYNIVKL